MAGERRNATDEKMKKCLKQAVEDLEPKSAGGPSKEVPAQQDTVESLEAEVRRLRAELDVSHVKEELMLGMPHLFKPEKGAKKKGSKKR